VSHRPEALQQRRIPRPSGRVVFSWRSVGAALVVLLFAGPLLLLVGGSFATPGAPPPLTPELIPDPVETGNYAEAMDLVRLGRATANSLLVAAVAVPLSVLVASWAGFAMTQLAAMSRGGARLAKFLVVACLVSLMVPLTALLVPRFAMFRILGLTDTLLPLMAPALIGTAPFYVLVYYVAFRGLPRDLLDACRLASLGALRTWWAVAMPLVRPVTVAVAALVFVFTWSNLLDPLIYVYNRDLWTVPRALRSLSTIDPTSYPVLLAGAVIASLPALLVFAVAQRRFLHNYRGAGWLGR
jgi:multiple sugar transport system permease protein